MSFANPATFRTSAAHRQLLVRLGGADLQLTMGAGLLGLGAAIYWLARPAGYGAWLGAAPSFLHPLAMILLCAAVLRPRRRAALALCGFWVVINLAFEAGQWRPAAATLFSWLGAHCGAVFACQRTAGFFLHGTFDWMDVAATLAGGGVAWRLLRVTSSRRGACS